MTAPDKWTDGVRQVQAESGGVVGLHILDRADVAALVVHAAGGDPQARRLVIAACEAIRQVMRAPKRAPALCCACPRNVRNPGLIGVAMPDRDDPGTAIGFVFCSKCSIKGKAHAHAKAVTAIRALWPDARPVPPIVHAAGHA